MSKTKSVHDFLAWYYKVGKPKYIKVDWDGVDIQADIEYQNQWRAGVDVEETPPSPFKTEKAFLDWFYKTKPSYIKLVGKSPKKVVRKSPKKVVRKSPKKVVRKSPVGCRVMNSQKYKKRPGPPRPANESGCRNKLALGNNGLLYESKVNKAGVYRWVKVKN